MSATAFNVFDLEIEWQDAPNGFSDGYDFKTWLAGEVISLRAERDRLLVEVQLMRYLPIPTIAEIYPHPDPVYGHCFKWPSEEVDQFMEMLPE